jgi:hypothetical protein
MRSVVVRIIAASFVASMLAVASPPQALAATPVVTDGAPAAATSTRIGPNNHAYQWVFWAGANGYLWWTHWDGSWHQPQSTTQSGRLGSAPTVAISPLTGTIYVFWSSFDGILYEFSSTNGAQSWNGPTPLTLTNMLGSAPSATSDPLGRILVFWSGPNNDLYQDVWNPNGGWSGALLIPGQGPLGGRPAAMSGWNSSVGSQWYMVSWMGQDGHLWTTNFNLTSGGNWTQPGSCSQCGAIGSAPTIAYAPRGMAGTLGWLGHYWAGSVPFFTNIWTHAPNNICATNTPCKLPYGQLGSAPSAAGDDNGNVFVFWEGTNGNLWEGYFDAAANNGAGVWSQKPFTVMY